MSKTNRQRWSRATRLKADEPTEQVMSTAVCEEPEVSELDTETRKLATEPKPVYRPPHAWKGRDVLYFPEGHKTSKCYCAKVHSVNAQGIATLIVFMDNTVALVHRMSVRHIGDPFLADNPQYAMQNGAWDEIDEERVR